VTRRQKATVASGTDLPASTELSVGTELPAGKFSDWLDGVEGAIRGDNDSDVPCGSCTACCTSAQFVHIGPEEKDSLRHIPAELLFPAPGLPAGHVLIGYDERGHCPMLVEGACSIYAHRPRTCRRYDCRIFPATDVKLTDPGKGQIAAQADRWRFTFPDRASEASARAVQAAAAFLRAHPEVLPPRVGSNPTQLAVLAIDIHGIFLSSDVDGVITPEADVVRREIQERTESDKQA
jgi:Fe-S-cluster containining protein